MSKINRFAAISKTEDNDDGTITVFGVASTEAVDAHGEIVTKAAMENAFPDFFKHGTGALRAMHQPIAAGTVTKASINAAGETEIEAIVVDPVEVLKVRTGTYKGFSIGGSKLPGGYDAVTKTISAMKLTEISLVDRPANPGAVITMFKAEDAEPTTVTVSADDAAAVDQLAALLDKGEVSPARMVELVKEEIAKAKAPPFTAKDGGDKGAKKDDDTKDDPKAKDTKDDPKAKDAKDAKDGKDDETDPKAKKEKPAFLKDKADGADDIQKSMYSVSRFAELLSSIGCLTSDLEYELDWEKDDSKVPAKLRSWLTTGAALFKEVATEEIDEFLQAFQPKKADNAVILRADEALEIRKSLTAAGTVSLSDYLVIGKAHMAENELAELVLKSGYEKATDAVLARLAPDSEAIAKLADATATISKLEGERADLIAKVAKLEAMPAPSNSTLRIVVAKGTDLGGSDVVGDEPAKPILKADGSVDREATAVAEIKKLHQTGGHSLRAIN